MLWQPLDLATACPANSQLTACSALGYIFLNIITNLYSGSEDLRIQESIRHDNELNLKYKVAEDITKYEGDDEKEEFDFIVVGAGSAGCVVANRLSEIKKWKVLLLEAGPEEPDITILPSMSEVLLGSNVDWNYATQPSKHACFSLPGGYCVYARGKMMGGSSSINTMVTVRGNHADYDGWAAMGNRGWSYDEVLPYFKKSEKNYGIEGLDTKFHGTHGPQAISRFPYIDKPSHLLTEAFNEMGLPILDFDGAEQLGTKQAQAFSANGMRVSTNIAYIRPIRYKRRNLTVRPNSEAIQILIDEHKRAYGVVYITNNTIHTAYVRKDVIVSGGTINSPKLLLLSGIGPKHHLQNLNIPIIQNLPVGENLQDHVSFSGLIIALDNETSTIVNFKQMVDSVINYKNMEPKRGPMSSTGPYNSVAFYKTNNNLPAPDIQIQVQNEVLREYLNDPVNFPRVQIFPTVYYDSIQPRVQNIVTKSRGRLFLNASNPNGPPIIYNGYLEDPADFQPLINGFKILLQIENTRPFRSGQMRFVKIPFKGCKHTLWGSDEYVICQSRHYTYVLSHQVGTCKMGPEYDQRAVVDPRLRVYGVSGLRVIDASIMPVAVRGNTNAATIMIGEKGSDLIKEDWLHNYVPNYEHGAYRDLD